jgi:hypothetical protein
MTTATATLRYEANSIPSQYLSNSQKRAFEQIVELLAEAVSDVKERNQSEAQTHFPVIDADRKSRTVMISGDRGTGKTSLMLTLQQAITKSISDDNPIDRFGDRTKKDLLKIRNRVVWLEPLDMEHSSKSTNLFVSILARIDDAISNGLQSSESEKDHNYPYGISVNPIPGRDDILMDLRRLQVDASIAWEGNLIARSPNLDSDAYATEVQRAERARMKMNSRFRKLLDDIATKIPWGQSIKNPIFVLAVDDFDLNPGRCLDILKLIRSLNVPRLFTIVLGDEEVAEEVFRLDLQGDMSRIANVSIDARDALSSSFIKRIKHISPQAVRKLVPPHQRLKLKYNTIEESLETKPSTSEKSVKEILEQFELYTELPRKLDRKEKASKDALQYSLYDFLVDSVPEYMLAKDSSSIGQNTAITRRYRYKGARILETSLRETIDLWFSIRKANLASEEGDSAEQALEKKMLLITEIRDSTRKALYDDPLLDLESAERFIDEFESDLDEEVFRTYNLDLRLPLPQSHRIYTRNFGNRILSKYSSLSANYIEEFKLLYTTGFDTEEFLKKCDCDQSEKDDRNRFDGSCVAKDGSSAQNNLSPKTQAHLTLLHDLIATNPLAPIVGNYLVKPIGEYSIVTCNWEIDGGRKLCVPWRGAIFRTIRELEIFSNSWDVFMESTRRNNSDVNDIDVDYFGHAWFIMNLLTVMGYGGIDKGAFDSYMKNSHSRMSSVLRLLKEAISVARSSDGYGKTRTKWTLEGLFSNLSVASGLSPDFCKSILAEEKIKEYYKTCKARVSYIRGYYLANIYTSLSVYKELFLAPSNFLSKMKEMLKSVDEEILKENRSPFNRATDDSKKSSPFFQLELCLEGQAIDIESKLTSKDEVFRWKVLKYLDSVSKRGSVSLHLDRLTSQWTGFLDYNSGTERFRAALRLILEHYELVQYAVHLNEIIEV